MSSKAKDSTQIEDQFPFQDKAITQVLDNRLGTKGPEDNHGWSYGAKSPRLYFCNYIKRKY